LTKPPRRSALSILPLSLQNFAIDEHAVEGLDRGIRRA
jgi:hypothetical protein